MLHTEGIVLKTIKYGETSLIVEVLTLEKGLQKFIIGGVRTAKGGRKKSISQLMSIIDIVSYFSERKTLHRIKEVGYHHIYRQLPFDLIRRSVGLFILEMVRKTLVGSECEPNTYQFIKNQFLLLDSLEKIPSIFPVKFLFEFTRFLGFYPGPRDDEAAYFDLRNGVFTQEIPDHIQYIIPDTAAYLEQVRTLDLISNSRQFPKVVREELLSILLDYYTIHIDHFKPPLSLPVLRDVLH